MPDYSKGKIYTLRCCTDNTLIYVGSTTQSLAVRLGGHKKNSRQESHKNRLIFKTINDDWDNWYIELYELYPCSCREELHKREGEIIRLIGNLNKIIAGRTDKEYREDNKEHLKKHKKEHYENNKEKKAEYGKIYREQNKDKVLEWAKNYKERKIIYDKKYREDNKEKKAKTDKAYYEANKEKKAEYDKIYREKKKQEKQNQIN